MKLPRYNGRKVRCHRSNGELWHFDFKTYEEDKLFFFSELLFEDQQYATILRKIGAATLSIYPCTIRILTFDLFNCRISLVAFGKHFLEHRWKIWYRIKQHQNTFIFDPHDSHMWSFLNPHISKCLIMPKWHQPVPLSGDVGESENSQNMATRLQGVLLCHLDYMRYSDCSEWHKTTLFLTMISINLFNDTITKSFLLANFSSLHHCKSGL